MPSLRQFTAEREADWATLQRLLDRSQGNGLRSLSAAEIDALGRAYRAAVSDLAVAQRDFPHDQLTEWLNALVARAHLRLYTAPTSSWRRIGRFFWTDFARRFREARWYVLLAALLLFLPGLWAYAAVLADENLRAALVPAELRAIMAQGRTWTDIEPSLRPAMASLIFTNNIRVSFAAFAGGVLFGLGTLYVLVANGLSLGSVLGAARVYGVDGLLWGFVSAHGYLELTGVVIASAGGLMLGDALVRPGLLRRRDALTLAARRSVELVAGAAPIFVAAGLVEALVSPSDLPTPIKLALGPALGLALWAALLTVGREPRRGRRQDRSGSPAVGRGLAYGTSAFRRRMGDSK
jgi:uncharacterized membrane protein SpoIIM required for sporulation